MARFTTEIDIKLVTLAQRLNARLSKDRPDYPEPLRTFEERRIDWIDDLINKAIIFQPTFEPRGVNEEIWNFGIAAWYFEHEKDFRFFENIVQGQQFDSIVSQLDELLVAAVERLNRMNMAELMKYNGF